MLRVLGVVGLLAAISVAGLRPIGGVLFATALAAHVLSSLSPRADIAVVSEAARFAFLCYVMAITVRRVMRDRTVTFDTVAGAACSYMLLGVVWGDLFSLVERWRPGSFVI